MSSTARRHENVAKLRSRLNPNRKVKQQGREAAKRRAEAVNAALARLEECGVIQGSVE